MGARIRTLGRLVLMDESERVLLLRYQHPSADPSDPGLTTYWVPPGGGRHLGESFEEAARREVLEETGIQVDEIGPWVWTREVMRPNEERRYHERYFLARTSQTDIRPVEGDADDVEPRWWPLSDIARSNEVFLPDGFALLLADLQRDGPPTEPRLLTN